MKFGICTTCVDSAAAKAAGWDYIEESVRGLLHGELPDDQWEGAKVAAGSVLPIPAGNLLVPGSMKIVGPAVDEPALRQYMERVMRRAGRVGMKTVVFGSGGAREVPEGFDREEAEKQIIRFVRYSAELARRHGVTIVAEPLNTGECNIMTSVPEAMRYVKEVDHPNFLCLVDSYHFWLEHESLDDLRKAMPWIAHVHVADVKGRVAPGESGESDYQPFFRVLKNNGYDGCISVEALGFNVACDAGERVLKYIRKQWEEA